MLTHIYFYQADQNHLRRCFSHQYQYFRKSCCPQGQFNFCLYFRLWTISELLL